MTPSASSPAQRSTLRSRRTTSTLASTPLSSSSYPRTLSSLLPWIPPSVSFRPLPANPEAHHTPCLQCGYACSDHASWYKYGFPTTMPFEAVTGNDNPIIHSSSDATSYSGFSWSHSLEFAKASLVAPLSRYRSGAYASFVLYRLALRTFTNSLHKEGSTARSPVGIRDTYTHSHRLYYWLVIVTNSILYSRLQ